MPIRVLPERRALDHLRVDDGPQRQARSGTRKRKSKPRVSVAPDNNEPQKAMFDFLNVTIHASAKGKPAAGGSRPGSGSNNRIRPCLLGRKPVFDGGSSTSQTDRAAGGASEGAEKGAGHPAASTKRAVDMSRSELRSHLVGAREAEAALAAKIARLEETIERNSERDPRIAARAKQKLEEVKGQAQEVRASRNRAERVLGDRGDKGKGGGKGGLFSF